MKTAGSRLLVFGITVLCATGTLLHGQAKSNHRTSVSETILADPFNAGRETAHVLGSTEKEATFTLMTSWIPGPDRKGYFRWQMGVSGEGVTLSEAPKFINSLHNCTYTLNVYDHGGFVLRHIPILFLRSVADSGDITAMSSNDLIQMNSAEYQKFVFGSWDVSWSCPEK